MNEKNNINLELKKKQLELEELQQKLSNVESAYKKANETLKHCEKEYVECGYKTERGDWKVTDSAIRGEYDKLFHCVEELLSKCARVNELVIEKQKEIDELKSK